MLKLAADEVSAAAGIVDAFRCVRSAPRCRVQVTYWLKVVLFERRLS